MLFSMFLPPFAPVHIYLVVRANSQYISTRWPNVAGAQLVFQSLLGLLAGWGIGSAGMKAALAVRSQLLIESTLQKTPNRSVAP
jgi:hypothetical protein